MPLLATRATFSRGALVRKLKDRRKEKPEGSLVIKPELSLTNGVRKVGRALEKICENLTYFISIGNPS